MSGNFDDIPFVDGYYLDPIHAATSFVANIYNLPDPWMGGTRFMARMKDKLDSFVVVGCDDSHYWWTLYGTFSDKAAGAVDLDFGPKAPHVGMLKCAFKPGSIAFLNDAGEPTNIWPQLKPSADFEFQIKDCHTAFNDINGLYTDPALYKPGSFAGVRVISDRLGKMMRDELVLVGSDDGITFWSVHGGAWTDKVEGKFTIGEYVGSINKGPKGTSPMEITLEGHDGPPWVKMMTKSDPKKLLDPELYPNNTVLGRDVYRKE